jgi:hypothetical protein
MHKPVLNIASDGKVVGFGGRVLASRTVGYEFKSRSRPTSDLFLESIQSVCTECTLNCVSVYQYLDCCSDIDSGDNW